MTVPDFDAGRLLVPDRGACKRMEKLARVATWSGPDAARLRKLYHVELTRARSHVPPGMRAKLSAAGRNLDQFLHQESIGIASRVLPAVIPEFHDVILRIARRWAYDAVGDLVPNSWSKGSTAAN